MIPADPFTRFLLALLIAAVVFFVGVLVVVYVAGRAGREADAASWTDLGLFDGPADAQLPEDVRPVPPAPLVPPFGSTWRPWLIAGARVVHTAWGLGTVVTAPVGGPRVGVLFDSGFGQWCLPVDLDPAPADLEAVYRRAADRGAVRVSTPAQNGGPVRLGGSHCCVCASSCSHIGPLSLCANHQPGSAAGT